MILESFFEHVSGFGHRAQNFVPNGPLEIFSCLNSAHLAQQREQGLQERLVEPAGGCTDSQSSLGGLSQQAQHAGQRRPQRFWCGPAASGACMAQRLHRQTGARRTETLRMPGA